MQLTDCPAFSLCTTLLLSRSLSFTAVRCEPDNKDIFAPVSVLRKDFLAFCEPRGLTLAAGTETAQTRTFVQLLESVKPELRGCVVVGNMRFRGQSANGSYRLGIQLAPDASDAKESSDNAAGECSS